MAMHIMPAYYTTTRTRRRKKGKKSKSLLAAEREHEKFLKKMKIRGGSSVGRASALQAEGQGFASLPLLQNTASVAQKEEKLICNHQVVGSIPTTGTISGTPCTKSEPKVYTGDEIIGIAQMHKSNAVPIRRKKDAIDTANMRR